MILDEAKRLYDILMKHLTNSIMDNSVGASSSSSDLKLSDTYRIEEPEIYHIAKMILLNDGIISNVFLPNSLSMYGRSINYYHAWLFNATLKKNFLALIRRTRCTSLSMR